MTAAIKEAAWQAKMLGANGDARELDLRQRRALATHQSWIDEEAENEETHWPFEAHRVLLIVWWKT